MKKWIVLILVVGAGFGGYWAWNHAQKSHADDAPTAIPTTAIVETRNINFSVNAAGEIGPAEQVSVRPEINGKIEELPVDVGVRVKKGDLLFKLDDKELQQGRASIVTDVDRAKVGVDKAERDLARSKKLLGENLISQ